MSAERFLAVHFCDDIRHELGNKYSLIGCYHGEMIVNAFPSTLAKLCAEIRIFTPINNPFQSLTLNAILNGQLIGQLQIQPEALKPNFGSISEGALNEAKGMMLMSMMVFSPLVISQAGVLEVQAETESGMLNGAKLWIRERVETDPPLL